VNLQIEETRKLVRGLAVTPARLSAALLLAALFVVSIYRAATQSISHDEAVIFEWLLSGPWSQVLNGVHGNHHVVTDLLSKLMITLFGTSEFALRVPALAGALLYFYSVFQISAFLFGGGLFFLLSVALLSLNPFVLDYLCCARGYGLALGLFFYALHEVLLTLDEPPGRTDKRTLRRGGIALGLSIGCNPIMAFPGAALTLCFLALLFLEGSLRLPDPTNVGSKPSRGIPKRNPKEERRRNARRGTTSGPRSPWREACLHFAVPAVSLSALISILPQRLIELEPGYFGPPSLLAILDGLVRNSFVHSPAGFRGLAAWLSPEAAIRITTQLVVPGLLVGLVAAALRIAFLWIGNRSLHSVSRIDRSLLLLGAMLPLLILLIAISRYVFEQPYPELRTAMYWLPLLGLACMGLVVRLSRGSRLERGLAVPAAAILVLCVAQFVTQFNTRYYAEWTYCAAGKDMMRAIRADHPTKPLAHVHVGATWQLEPVINFYRVAWELDWMDPVYRQSPSGPYDYYMLLFDDAALVERLSLQPLMRDRLSGSVLARRASL
jgi:hypothetical protein